MESRRLLAIRERRLKKQLKIFTALNCVLSKIKPDDFLVEAGDDDDRDVDVLIDTVSRRLADGQKKLLETQLAFQDICKKK